VRRAFVALCLDNLVMILRLFTDKLEVSGGLDIGSQLSAARRRARLGKATTSADEDDPAGYD
jgi:hypothetical protein